MPLLADLDSSLWDISLLNDIVAFTKLVCVCLGELRSAATGRIDAKLGMLRLFFKKKIKSGMPKSIFRLEEAATLQRLGELRD